jgi:hypothetical protein
LELDWNLWNHCCSGGLSSSIDTFFSIQSTLVQNISVLIYLVLILFIIVAGATQVDNSNYVPFAPYGIDVRETITLSLINKTHDMYPIDSLMMI